VSTPPPGDGVLTFVLGPSEPWSLQLDDGTLRRVREVGDAHVTPGPAYTDGLVSWTEDRGDRLVVAVARIGVVDPLVTIELERATRASIRRAGDRLLVADDRGRILLVSIERAVVLAEWRLA